MTRTERHDILIIEDEPKTADVLRDLVRSMDFDCRIATTLDEAKALLETITPCAVLQDMQIPHVAGARPHEKAGETSIRLVRRKSSGGGRVPVIVVTAYRSDPDFVWQMAELEADAFVAKANMGALGDKLLAALKKNGREDHARCAACNGSSRPVDVKAEEAAVLFAHDRRAVPLTVAEIEALHDRRAELDLYLDAVRVVEGRGYLAGFRDHGGVFHETYLPETSASVLAELVEARRAIRADALRRLKKSEHTSAVRQVQTARKAVDVRAMVDGRESRTLWRSFHTEGGKGATAFRFEPPSGMTYAVLVKKPSP